LRSKRSKSTELSGWAFALESLHAQATNDAVMERVSAGTEAVTSWRMGDGTRGWSYWSNGTKVTEFDEVMPQPPTPTPGPAPIIGHATGARHTDTPIAPPSNPPDPRS
jgi:hypothetical protein